MGLYLTPIDTTKGEWLKEYGHEVALSEWTWEKRELGQMPLCLIFTPYPVILICYFKREMSRALPIPGHDHRPRRYFFAPIKEVAKHPDMKGCISAMRADARDYTPDTVELEGLGADD